MEKKWRELDILIREFGQGTVIVKSHKSKEEQQFIEAFREHLNKSHKVLYIDFAKVHNMRDIAKHILVQIRLLFEDSIDEELNESLRFWEQEDDHRFFDAVLKAFNVRFHYISTEIPFFLHAQNPKLYKILLHHHQL